MTAKNYTRYQFDPVRDVMLASSLTKRPRRHCLGSSWRRAICSPFLFLASPTLAHSSARVWSTAGSSRTGPLRSSVQKGSQWSIACRSQPSLPSGAPSSSLPTYRHLARSQRLRQCIAVWDAVAADKTLIVLLWASVVPFVRYPC
jgi:hypothetical protein